MLTCIATVVATVISPPTAVCHTSSGHSVEFRPVLVHNVFPSHMLVVIRFLPKEKGDDGPPWAAVFGFNNEYQY